MQSWHWRNSPSWHCSLYAEWQDWADVLHTRHKWARSSAEGHCQGEWQHQKTALSNFELHLMTKQEVWSSIQDTGPVTLLIRRCTVIHSYGIPKTEVQSIDGMTRTCHLAQAEENELVCPDEAKVIGGHVASNRKCSCLWHQLRNDLQSNSTHLMG